MKSILWIANIVFIAIDMNYDHQRTNPRRPASRPKCCQLPDHAAHSFKCSGAGRTRKTGIHGHGSWCDRFLWSRGQGWKNWSHHCSSKKTVWHRPGVKWRRNRNRKIQYYKKSDWSQISAWLYPRRAESFGLNWCTSYSEFWNSES